MSTAITQKNGNYFRNIKILLCHTIISSILRNVCAHNVFNVQMPTDQNRERERKKELKIHCICHCKFYSKSTTLLIKNSFSAMWKWRWQQKWRLTLELATGDINFIAQLFCESNKKTRFRNDCIFIFVQKGFSLLLFSVRFFFRFGCCFVFLSLLVQVGFSNK